MLLTRETDYALRILRALASGERITAQELSENEQIPHQFAYKILKKLQNAGFVGITRGTDGGCSLKAALSDITLYQLICAMERDTAIGPCMRAGYACQWRKAHGNAICHANSRLLGIQRTLDNELQSHTLQEILFEE